MAVVIRLLGLPFVAGPVDIRQFFKGLTIPDGGVHIIGGEVGLAFIIFATDEDARRAVSRSGGLIKDSSVELFLSSRAEMQKIIDMKRTDRTGRERPGSGGARAGTMSNFVGEIKEDANNSGYSEAEFHANGTERDDLKSRTRPVRAKNPYLFLRGLPYLVNEDDVRVFFAGLCVDGVIFLKHHDGRNNGDAIVKFASCIDASGGLKCHRSFMGSRFIEVMQSSDEQWTQCGGKLDAIPSEEHSPPRGISDRHFRKRSHSKSPRRTRSRSPVGNYVHLKNLSLNITKRDIKNFFRATDLSNEQITFLYKDDKRTRHALVMFKTLRDFYSALALHKTVVQYRPVYIDPISKKRMLKLMEYYDMKKPIEKERPGHVSQKYSQEGYPGLKLCIYIRNFPFDVTKVEVQKFFADFSLTDDDIYLFYDDKGVGLGEALVKFRSEEEAMKAESLNRRRFLGTEVLLRLISEAQMQEFGIDFPMMSDENMQDRSQSHGRDDHSHSFDSKEPLEYSVGSFENFTRHQLEDERNLDSFQHPQEDFREPARHPLEDFRHSPEDFRCPPDDFRRPREERFRRPEDNFKRPREDDWRRSSEDWRRPFKEDFRRPPKDDWRQPLEGDYRRPPDEDWRRPPEEDFRRYHEEDFRRYHEEDFRHSPEEDFRRPPQEHLRHPSQEHYRRPSQEHYRRPPQEHFRKPPQEYFRRQHQEYFRRPPQEHFRRPPQEHFRGPREEEFRYPPDEDFRGPSDEDFRHPPDEDFRNPREDFPCPSDEDFRQLPEEDLGGPQEEGPRLADHFRPPGEEFRNAPDDFRSHRPFVNFGRPEGGKFDFGKRNMGGFPEGRFMPEPKLNCGSDRITPVKIMNLPFKANVNEILDFFHGYKVIPESVSIQYNEKGLPIGEAIVTMINYNEAMAAIKDLNDRPVGPRKVKLILL
ncbi:RNA-binding protein 12B [Echinops telfairi]|uniref:RNA-binding protein 12B n=3 Tax=Echinops telfairi TaxID=9371 RepID=A0ABM0IDE9_ECHTE|nr:RNA-binding protein 12B [Echinops telfairi]XP_045142054.1 RNA-binding protein 12B [Echinops telfairi]XP_045142060.1 RNA-binding protein 12B [Echinops telfairi]